MDAHQKIKQFIESHIQHTQDTVELKTDHNIFDRGFLDSMFALQLINFVEEEFGIEVTDEDLDIENFKSIERIVTFIKRKKR